MNIKILLQGILIGIVMTVIFILLEKIADINVPTWLGIIIIVCLISFFSRVNKQIMM
jgi:hypothetical protein